MEKVTEWNRRSSILDLRDRGIIYIHYMLVIGGAA